MNILNRYLYFFSFRRYGAPPYHNTWNTVWAPRASHSRCSILAAHPFVTTRGRVSLLQTPYLGTINDILRTHKYHTYGQEIGQIRRTTHDYYIWWALSPPVNMPAHPYCSNIIDKRDVGALPNKTHVRALVAARMFIEHHTYVHQASHIGIVWLMLLMQ